MGGYSIGEDEEIASFTANGIELRRQLTEFGVQHRFQPCAADIMLGWAVKAVADRHVVSGNRSGNRG